MDAPHFDAYLGLSIERATGDRVVATLDLEAHHNQPYGIVHGGVWCSIVESLASIGAATWAMDQGLLGVVGVQNSTDFLRSARGGRVEAEATPIHRGRTQQLWQVVIRAAGTDRALARGQVRLQNLTDASVIGGITDSRPPVA